MWRTTQGPPVRFMFYFLNGFGRPSAPEAGCASRFLVAKMKRVIKCHKLKPDTGMNELTTSDPTKSAPKTDAPQVDAGRSLGPAREAARTAPELGRSLVPALRCPGCEGSNSRPPGKGPQSDVGDRQLVRQLDSETAGHGLG